VDAKNVFRNHGVNMPCSEIDMYGMVFWCTYLRLLDTVSDQTKNKKCH